MKSLVAFFINRSLLVNLLTVFVVVVGILQYKDLRREAFPHVDFDIVSINTFYLGASPLEVEQYVTNPIEDELAALTGISEQDSVSIEARSIVVVKVDPDLSKEEKRKTIDEIFRAVDRVSNLPEDLPAPPLVRELSSGDMPIIEIAISSKNGYKNAQKFSDALKDRLIDIPDISRVSLNGYREREYWIEIDPKKLKKFDLGLTEIVATLAANNINLPGGLIETDSGDVLARTIGELKTIADLEQVVLRASDYGSPLTIGDVATVKENFEDRSKVVRTRGEESINLVVTKNETGDILSLVDAVRKQTAEFEKNWSKDAAIKVSYLNDISIFVSNRLEILTSNGFYGSILVLLVLFLFIHPVIGLVAVLGIPVAALAAIAIMGYSGNTINLITMFGMVMVLGMLVDDAIVVAENIWQQYEDGKSAYDACIDGTAEVISPVTATVLTSIAAFSPLLIMSGIFGQFISYLPTVLIFALGMSLLEALFVLPSHTYDMLIAREKWLSWRKSRIKKVSPTLNRKNENKKIKESLYQKLLQKYSSLLRLTLRFRYLFAGSFLVLFLGSMFFAVKKMPFLLFPAEGIEIFFLRADLPLTSGLENSETEFLKIEKIIENEISKDELLNFVTNIGEQRDDPNDPLAQRGTHLGQIQVFLTPEKDRKARADEIIERIRKSTRSLVDVGPFTQIKFSRVRTGPPIGKPVAVRLRGDSLEKLEEVGKLMVDRLARYEGVSDVGMNYRDGKAEFQIFVDDVAARRALLSKAVIAKSIRVAFEGSVATEIREGSDLIAVRVRLDRVARHKRETLENLLLQNEAGRLIPFASVAKIVTKQGKNAIFHWDFRRSVTISADLDENITNSRKINDELSLYIEELKTKYPDVAFSSGGEWEDTTESIASLQQAFIIALCLVFIILATLFNSLTQPFVVMAAIPFGMIGVIWSFYFHNLPLSFIGMIGAIGLAGVVVNDSIVLVDFINASIKKGTNLIDAAVESGARRMRAIWLTTITTVCGVLPLVYGIGGEDRFLQPAAVALGYGLMFGTLLTLFLVPSLYLIRVDILEFLRVVPKRSRNQI